MIGIRIGLILPQTNETSVAKICPTSAITDRVNGIPIIAKRMLKARPATVTGAIFPNQITQSTRREKRNN